ncbi:hypothetical protein NLG97_g7834 [Lecanicillium saksenae]|uniref:Uncharacterized protein n=1 Tax=Lecanicillium saksenae TaxID=468837 RepID=A0ACC1QLT5_9HYPO|nr:hypothetical protein NLG97_g7834 [Lecanicillium saksenae]
MAGGTHRQTGAAGSGVLFEVIFNNANPRKKPGHGISLSYGGQVYRCNDAESIRSVHTIHTDDEEEAADSRSPGKNSVAQDAQEKPNSFPFAPIPRVSASLSPSHQSRARSILAPFSNLSRKFVRRHSYDEGVKTKREKSPVRQETRREQRPTVQGVHPGFAYAPQPIPFIYQNHIPMYQYVPAQTQTVFGAAPMAYPTAQAAPSAAPQCPPELQHLQARIDHATCSLAANPIDLHAKQELNRLLAERNSFLDSATKRPAQPSAAQPAATLKPEADESRTTTEKSLIVDCPGREHPEKETIAAEASDESVASEKQHICSGCGAARSPSFHRKHPFAKPVHNVCRKCRVGKRAPSVVRRYHFCSSCGIVRSKEYHRRRGNAASVSLRSQICRKCHANGDSMRNVLLPSKRPSQEEKLVKPYAKPSALIRVERTRSVPREQSVSAEDNQSLGYDGASNFASSVQPEKYKTESSSPTKADFHSYRSPEVSDESISDRRPSLESSLRSSGASSPVYKEELHEESGIKNDAIPASEREWNPESFHVPEQASNPYYQPRNATTRLSSPFQYTDASNRSRHLEHPVSEVYSQPSDHDTRPDSPRLQDAQNPSFATRNQSWPGDLNLPSSPSVFSGFSSFHRKVSASEGAQTPQHSPIADTHPSQWHEASGARFTKGAFGRPASSLRQQGRLLRRRLL